MLFYKEEQYDQKEAIEKNLFLLFVPELEKVYRFTPFSHFYMSFLVTGYSSLNRGSPNRIHWVFLLFWFFFSFTFTIQYKIAWITLLGATDSCYPTLNVFLFTLWAVYIVQVLGNKSFDRQERRVWIWSCIAGVGMWTRGDWQNTLWSRSSCPCWMGESPFTHVLQ